MVTVLGWLSPRQLRLATLRLVSRIQRPASCLYPRGVQVTRILTAQKWFWQAAGDLFLRSYAGFYLFAVRTTFLEILWSASTGAANRLSLYWFLFRKGASKPQYSGMRHGVVIAL